MAPLQAAELARQPFSGTDVGAFVLAVLAVIFALQWWRDREPGLLWLAGGVALLALWWAATPLHVPQGLQVRSPMWSAVAMGGLLLSVVGLVHYLGTPPAVARWVLPLLLAPVLGVLAWLALGDAPNRRAVMAATLFTYVGTAALAFWAARREPGVGHAVLGLAMLSLPLTVVAAWWWVGDAAVVRYGAVLPVVVLLLTLLTISLVRRRRALEAEVRRRQHAEASLTALNASLEHTVAERTADLQHLVQGLQSFNRSVSHDLRGPLGGMAVLARLAMDALARGDADHATTLLTPIAAQAERSERLVGALLTLAHVSDAPLQPRPVDLQSLAHQALDALALAPGGLPVAAVQIGALPEAAGDAELLAPVFVNLIGNALKFVQGQAAPRVQVSARQVPGELVVSVQDNGIGFSTSQAQRLFEPFVRLHGRQFDGSGVGLSIVRRAVERHGGRVWAEGRPGEGATFHFSLPA